MRSCRDALLGGLRELTEVVSEHRRHPLALLREHRRRGLWRGWVLGVHLLTLMLGLAVLITVNSGQWFVADEWVFLSDRRLGDLRTVFAPHNEHWSTLPIVLWRGLFATVGLRSYWPYQLAALAVHVGIAHLLWRVQLRAGVSSGIAIATSGLFLLFGAGAENLLSAFAITFGAPVLLGLGHVLLVDHEGRFDRRDGLGLMLALAGLLSSGVAISMVAVAGLTAVLRRGWRAGLATVGPPAVVFIVWLATAGRSGLRGEETWEPGRIPAFVWYGLTAVFDVAASTSGLGVVALAGLASWLLRHRRELRGRLAATTACGLGAVVFFAMIGIGRAMLSASEAGTSRYLYVAAALLIPAVGGALSDLTVRRRIAEAGAIVLVALLVTNGARLLMARATAERAIEQQHRRILLAAARLDLPPTELGLPEPVGLAHNLTYNELREMRRQGQLPSDEDVTRDHELLALAIVQVSATPTPQLPVGPQAGGPTAMTTRLGALVEAPPGLRPLSAGPGCLRFEPNTGPSEVLIHVPVPVALRLLTAGDHIGVFLRDEDGTTSRMGLEIRLRDSPTYLNLNLQRQDVELTLPGTASSTLCGLAVS